ncbi:MAG: hypothetical protein ACXWNI_03310, partial [Candidatus Limnocylindrales bacterium]
TPAAVRQRFGSKRGLLVEMARRRVDQTQGRFAAARAAHDSPLEALQAAFVAGLDQISEPKQLANAMSAYTDNVDIDEMREAFGTELAVMELNVTELLTLAVEAGEVHGPVTPELVSSVLAAVEGTMFIWALVPRGDLEVRIHQAVDGALGRAAEGAG